MFPPLPIVAIDRDLGGLAAAVGGSNGKGNCEPNWVGGGSWGMLPWCDEGACVGCDWDCWSLGVEGLVKSSVRKLKLGLGSITLLVLGIKMDPLWNGGEL